MYLKSVLPGGELLCRWDSDDEGGTRPRQGDWGVLGLSKLGLSGMEILWHGGKMLKHQVDRSWKDGLHTHTHTHTHTH